MNFKQNLVLLGFIVLSQAAGLIGSLFTAPAINSWYVDLIKPGIAPPNWVFAPVWTTLFLLMGVSAFLVWRRGIHRAEVKVALVVFLIQLILNISWSFLFFGLRSPGAAMIEILILWLAIFANIIVFYKLSKIAGLLLVPYLLWVSFASYLNFLIWNLNL